MLIIITNQVSLINPLISGPDYTRISYFYLAHCISAFKMLNLKRDIDQQDFWILDLYFVISKQFSATWSCGSRQRDTALSGWKLKLNNFAIKWLTQTRLCLSTKQFNIHTILLCLVKLVNYRQLNNGKVTYCLFIAHEYIIKMSFL